MTRYKIYLFIIITLFICQQSIAEEVNLEKTSTEIEFEFSEEEEMDFDEPDSLTKDDKPESVKKTFNPIKTTFDHQWSQRTKAPKSVVSNRTSARFEWEQLFAGNYFFLIDGKLTAYYDNDHQTIARDKDFYSKGDLRETFLQVSLGDFNLKVGKQIIVWGEAEAGLATDVISPRDQSEFLFTTLENSRIGQNLILLSGFFGSSSLELFIIPEPEVNKEPIKGSEYYPKADPALSAEINESNEREVEAGIRWKTNMGKGDISLMLAHVVDNQPVLEYEGINQSNLPIFKKTWKPYDFAGIAANYATGNFLLKFEAAYKKGKFFQGANYAKDQGLIQTDQIDTAIGFDYDANGAYSLFLEVSNSYIYQWTSEITYQKQSESIAYLNWSKNFINETLTTAYSFSIPFVDKSKIHQAKVTWKWTDDFHIEADYTHLDIQSEEDMLWEYSDADRFTFNMKYFL